MITSSVVIYAEKMRVQVFFFNLIYSQQFTLISKPGLEFAKIFMINIMNISTTMFNETEPLYYRRRYTMNPGIKTTLISNFK